MALWANMAAGGGLVAGGQKTGRRQATFVNVRFLPAWRLT